MEVGADEDVDDDLAVELATVLGGDAGLFFCCTP